MLNTGQYSISPRGGELKLTPPHTLSTDRRLVASLSDFKAAEERARGWDVRKTNLRLKAIVVKDIEPKPTI